MLAGRVVTWESSANMKAGRPMTQPQMTQRMRWKSRGARLPRRAKRMASAARSIGRPASRAMRISVSVG